MTHHWVGCCWEGGGFSKGKNDENLSPARPQPLPCHGVPRVCSKLHPSAQAKTLCKIAPSPSDVKFNFTSPWRTELICNFLGITRSAELQLLALDSRHFYEILVPGLVVWHRKHIIHTQNNCIKITLGIWLKLTKPRKLRIKAESMSLSHPLRARCGRWGGVLAPLPPAEPCSLHCSKEETSCTSTEAPPPSGSNNPSLCLGILVQSDKS